MGTGLNGAHLREARTTDLHEAKAFLEELP